MDNSTSAVLLAPLDPARRKLRELVESGTRPVRLVRRALILLKSDAGSTDLQTVEHVGCAERTVRNARKWFCTEGLEGTLHDAARPGRPPEFTPRQKQQVVALPCTEPPEGPARWTPELLCKHAAKRGFLTSVSKSKVALWLKEHDVKP